MFRNRFAVAPLVSLTLAMSFVAGCGMTPSRPVVAQATASSVKMEAAARKETRRQAEARAKGYIEEFNGIHYRSIRSRTEMVEKIARTDADAAYDFLLQEIDDLQELRGEMPKLTKDEAETYEETLLGLLDDLTPDQAEVKARKAKAEALGMDLDELDITEGMANGTLVAQRAHVGSRSRVLTAIQESKLYKAAKKAYKNSKRKVKKALKSLWKKLHWH